MLQFVSLQGWWLQGCLSLLRRALSVSEPHFHPCCHTELAQHHFCTKPVPWKVGQGFGVGRECLTNRRRIAGRSWLSVSIRV